MGLVLDGPAALAAANGCQSLSTTPGTAGRPALLAIGRSFRAGRAAHHASTSCRPLGQVQRLVSLTRRNLVSSMSVAVDRASDIQ